MNEEQGVMILKKILFFLVFFATNSIFPAIDLSSSGNNPKIAMNGLNGVAIWEESPAIKSAYTSNGGNTWSASQDVSTSGINSRPAIFMEGTDVVVVWVGNTLGDNLEIYGRISSDSGITWDGLPVQIALSPGTQIFDAPQVAISGDNLVAVWEDSNGAILASYATFSGFSWSATITIYDGPIMGNPSALAPKVAMDGSNVVVVFFDVASNILQNHSNDAGVNWLNGDPHPISAGNSSAQVDIIGLNAIAVWENLGKIESKYSSDGGLNWSPVSPHEFTSGNTANPNVVMEGTNAVVIWGSAIGGTELVQASTSSDSGHTWSSSIPVSSSVGIMPDLAISGSSVATVWVSDPSNSTQASGSSNNGLTWSSPATLSDAGILTMNSHVAISGSLALGIWQTSDNIIQVSKINISSGNINIYLKKQHINECLLSLDVTNEIKWGRVAGAVLYRIYSDSSLNNRIAEVSSPSFYDHGIKAGVLKTYYITSVDSLGNESEATVVSIL